MKFEGTGNAAITLAASARIPRNHLVSAMLTMAVPVVDPWTEIPRFTPLKSIMCSTLFRTIRIDYTCIYF